MKQEHLDRIKRIKSQITPGKRDGTCVSKLNEVLLASNDREVRHEVHKAMQEMGIHHSGDCCHPEPK